MNKIKIKKKYQPIVQNIIKKCKYQQIIKCNYPCHDSVNSDNHFFKIKGLLQFGGQEIFNKKNIYYFYKGVKL